MSYPTTESKATMRAFLESIIAAYLAHGGTIRKVPVGLVSDPDSLDDWEDWEPTPDDQMPDWCKNPARPASLSVAEFASEAHKRLAA